MKEISLLSHPYLDLEVTLEKYGNTPSQVCFVNADYDYYSSVTVPIDVLKEVIRKLDELGET